MEPETAGDPMSERKWVRSSLRQLSRRLTAAGHPVSHQTVGRLLADRDFALHSNAKQIEARSAHPDRNAQFEHIAAQRQAFQAAGLPIISVDTKKKELVGNFKNAGRTQCRMASMMAPLITAPSMSAHRGIPRSLPSMRWRDGGSARATWSTHTPITC